MDEITLTTIEWRAPEYTHEEKSVDFFWTIGIIALIAAAIAAWNASYLFAIFILISGACLILFTLRPPQIIRFAIESEGLTMGKDTFEWKKVKGFHIKKGDPYAKLLVGTSRQFLPIFTIPLPLELASEVKETLLRVIPDIEIEESRSMQFMEKLGF